MHFTNVQTKRVGLQCANFVVVPFVFPSFKYSTSNPPVLYIVTFRTSPCTLGRFSSSVCESPESFPLRFAVIFLGTAIILKFAPNVFASAFFSVFYNILCDHDAFGGIVTFQTTSFGRIQKSVVFAFNFCLSGTLLLFMNIYITLGEIR